MKWSLILRMALCSLLGIACQAQPANVTPTYGARVIYVQGQPLAFPDFTLEFVGQRQETSPEFPRGFIFYDFTVTHDNQTQTVSWSSGAGDIGPAYFEVDGKPFWLELAYSDEHGWLEDDELVISEARN